MAYVVTHWTGAMEAALPPERFSELLDELVLADGEHSGVAVKHESEWSLRVDKWGFLVLENLEEGDPMHLGPVLDRNVVLGLMVAVAEGRVNDVRSAPWRRGYPPRV